jgi:para-nitrobenzyl esterase
MSKDASTLEEMKKNGKFNRFEIGNMMWIDANIRLGASPMYFYTFNPELPGDNAGSFHSSDLWFAFETLAKCWRPFKAKHYDLARQMCNYWANFIRSGDPNGKDADGSDMPLWKSFTEDDPNWIYFGDKTYLSTKGPSDLMKFLLKKYTK